MGVNEGLGARMGNSRDDLDDGCECPRGILAPYGGGGYRRLSKGQLPLG